MEVVLYSNDLVIVLFYFYKKIFYKKIYQS